MKQLDPVQKEGVAFLKKNRRVLLADDVGVGKTCQSLIATSTLECSRVLVFTKKYLIHQWECEAEYWLDVSVARYTSASKQLPNAKYIITNYDTAVHRQEQLLACEWEAVIVDEATAIKNRTAKRTKAIKKIMQNVPVRFLLTGTPIHNDPTELWSLLNALYPKEFDNYFRFVNTFCMTERNVFGGMDIVGLKNPDLLAQRLNGVLLRRTSEVLGLKEPLEEIIRLEMPPKQAKIYRDIEKHGMAQIGESVFNVPNVIAAFTRMQQVLCSPALLGGPTDSCKTEAVKELVAEYAPYEKVLVFTRFVDYAELLGVELAAFNTIVLHGKKKNEDDITRFKDDSTARVLVSTIGVGSEGLNLQHATVLIFADLPFVPKTLTQCVGRIQRRGQTNQVRIITLVADNTLDVHVQRILARKDQYISELEAVNDILKGMRR